MPCPARRGRHEAAGISWRSWQRDDVAARRAGAEAIKVYRVGYFFSTAPLAVMVGSDPIDPVSRAFVHGLRALGYTEGENLVLERRSAEGKFERIDEIAAELASLKLDVIVTGSGDFMAQALQRVTKSVPIVISGSFDPVGAGLVASLAHPGGTSRGSSNTLTTSLKPTDCSY